MIKLFSIFFIFLLTSMSSLASSKTISVLIPFSAGGPTDTLWRSIETELNKKLEKKGIHLVIENAPGAGGLIAANRIINHKGTILGFFSPSIAINPFLNENSNYKASDFILVDQLGSTKMMIVSTLASVKEIEEKCKSQTISYATSGLGSTTHLYSAYLAKKLNCIDAVPVHYRGIASAYPDIISGRIDFTVDFLPSARSQSSTGKVNMLGQMTDIEVESWHVLVSGKNSNPTEIKMIRSALLDLKKDKSFILHLEETRGLENFSAVRDQKWFEQQFVLYEQAVKSLSK